MGANENFDNFWTNLSDSVQCLVHVWMALILLSEEFIFVWKPNPALTSDTTRQFVGNPKISWTLNITFRTKSSYLLTVQSCVKVSETGWPGWEEGVKRKQTILQMLCGDHKWPCSKRVWGLTSPVNRIIDFKSDVDAIVAFELECHLNFFYDYLK